MSGTKAAGASAESGSRRGRPAEPGLRVARREAIVRSAYAVLTERGYDRTVMSDIARHAQIGQGTLYRYYPSKRELLDDVFDFAVAKATRALRIGTLADRDLTDYHQALELIAVFGERLFALVDEDPAIVRLITVESSAIDAELRHRVTGLLSTMDLALAQLFTQANPDLATEGNQYIERLLGRMVLGMAGPGLLMSLQGDASTQARATFLSSIAAISDRGLLPDKPAAEDVKHA